MKDNINIQDIQDQIKVMDYAFTGLKNFREAIGLDQSISPDATEPPTDEMGNVEPGDLYVRMTPEAQEENDRETEAGL